MMKIESYQQLREAKVLSKKRVLELEKEIRNDFEEIKNDLRPLNLAGRTFRSMLSSEKHGLVSESLGMGVNALVKGLLLRRTSFITKTLVAFAVKNIANNLVSKNSDNIFDWLQSHLRKLKSNRHQHNGQHYYDESTAGGSLDG
jgi:hypothetical protein